MERLLDEPSVFAQRSARLKAKRTKASAHGDVIPHTPFDDPIDRANVDAWLDEVRSQGRHASVALPSQRRTAADVKPAWANPPQTQPGLSKNVTEWADCVQTAITRSLLNGDSERSAKLTLKSHLVAHGIAQRNPELADIFCDVEMLLGIEASNEELPRTGAAYTKAFCKTVAEMLQKRQLKLMQCRVQENAALAKRGAEPGVEFDVLAFLNLLDVLHCDESPKYRRSYGMWSVIYHCLLVGASDVAKKVVRACAPQLTRTRFNVKHLCTAIESVVSTSETQLDDYTREELEILYRERVASSNDKYLRATFALLLPEMISENDYEDAINSWGQFMYHEIARAHATGSLTRLKRLLLEEYGETHFADRAKGGSRLLYARVLLLSDCYEQALVYMAQESGAAPAALHLALLLYTSGHLRLDDINEPTNVPKYYARYELHQAILRYVNAFVKGNRRLALDYMYTIIDLPVGMERVSAFEDYLRKLIRSAADVDELFGVIDANNQKREGLLDKYALDIRALARALGVHCVEHTSLHLAALLFDIGDDMEAAVGVLCDQLVAMIRKRKIEENSLTHATSLGKRIARGVAECQAADRTALFALLDLCMMMKLYLDKRYEDACKVLNELEFIPRTVQDLEACTQRLFLAGVQTKRAFTYCLTMYMDALYQTLSGTLLNETDRRALHASIEAILALSASLSEANPQWHMDLLQKANLLRKI